MNAAFVRFVCRSLVVCIAVLPMQAGAGLVATGDAAADSQRSQAARITIEGQLEALGVAASDAKLRVAALSDAEAASIAGRIDSAPAGANGAGLGFVLVLLFLIWRFFFSEQAQAEAAKAAPKPAPKPAAKPAAEQKK